MKKLFLICLIFAYYPLNTYSALCVENNTLKCDNLGYTKSTCPYGGIACPFDISRWYCAEWTCQDGRYKDKPGINDDCLEVEYKDMKKERIIMHAIVFHRRQQQVRNFTLTRISKAIPSSAPAIGTCPLSENF